MVSTAERKLPSFSQDTLERSRYNNFNLLIPHCTPLEASERFRSLLRMRSLFRDKCTTNSVVVASAENPLSTILLISSDAFGKSSSLRNP
uniref:Uncharacterized protein n=1 Tax=Manihot esculenta TaxID=3983 RepID=A0A2C9V6U9_MANES